MLPCETRLLTRVHTIVRQAIEERGVLIKQIPIDRGLLLRAQGRQKWNIQLRALARIADALGYDVIVQLREQRHVLCNKEAAHGEGV